LILAFAFVMIMVYLFKLTPCTFPFEIIVNECEVSTLKHALLVALSCGFERIIFETDSQIVVNLILNDYRYENELGTLLSTCKSLLSVNVSYNKLSFGGKLIESLII
jgi:hypothetical protein